MPNVTKESEIIMHRKEDGKTVQFKIIDNISKLSREDWYVSIRRVFVRLFFEALIFFEGPSGGRVCTRTTMAVQRVAMGGQSE